MKLGGQYRHGGCCRNPISKVFINERLSKDNDSLATILIYEHDSAEKIAEKILEFQYESLNKAITQFDESEMISLIHEAIYVRKLTLEMLTKDNTKDEQLASGCKLYLRLYIQYLEILLIKLTNKSFLMVLEQLIKIYDLINPVSEFSTFKKVISEREGTLDFSPLPLYQVKALLNLLTDNQCENITLIHEGKELAYKYYSRPSN